MLNKEGTLRYPWTEWKAPRMRGLGSWIGREERDDLAKVQPLNSALGLKDHRGSPLHPRCVAPTHPTLYWFTLTLNTCSWWWRADCSFADISWLLLHWICKLQGEFWCQFNGESLINMLAPKLTSFSVFLLSFEDQSIFDCWCCKLSQRCKLWDPVGFQGIWAREITYCADTGKGWSVVRGGGHTRNSRDVGCLSYHPSPFLWLTFSSSTAHSKSCSKKKKPCVILLWLPHIVDL